MEHTENDNKAAGAPSASNVGLADPEIKAMAAAIEYMENADEKSRRQFIAP